MVPASSNTHRGKAVVVVGTVPGWVVGRVVVELAGVVAGSVLRRVVLVEVAGVVAGCVVGG